MNVIARLEFELANFDSAGYRLNRYTTRTPPISIKKKNEGGTGYEGVCVCEKERERSGRKCRACQGLLSLSPTNLSSQFIDILFSNKAKCVWTTTTTTTTTDELCFAFAKQLLRYGVEGDEGEWVDMGRAMWGWNWRDVFSFVFLLFF